MNFEITKITPSMSHNQKVYEYARRLSFYAQAASSARAKSKQFLCLNTVRNYKLFGETCGCYKHHANDHHEPCEPCKLAHAHYLEFRSLTNKKATALRQLNNEMKPYLIKILINNNSEEE